ncbi:Helicase-like transcription factor CHR28 [Linum grandiflorum]
MLTVLVRTLLAGYTLTCICLATDLNQPKSEASLPDGLMAVPLLRHQRIALSWMVQKETSGFHCSGGILADDQGLGKTISTIALILKERSPCHGSIVEADKTEECETLDLDDEDGDQNTEVQGTKPERSIVQVISNQNAKSSINLLGQSKGKPAAGTLIVCPTSVLRQWAEELHKKVTAEANVTVLIYHGSNRTKDPYELAKYDVVLTTYSIVGIEVPKQPFSGTDDEVKLGVEDDDGPHLGPSGKKRKYMSGNKGGKKKEMDCALFETLARPLAKVSWFRVVLDEAQSIKNHKTQVAKACWGLRAKRRWCLSGTPLQNAVDDLYSYFRFLRCDPYSSYPVFCNGIKAPIQRDPVLGYRKLQAVLKTIMLRRTKGTMIDGEPIIILPPKSIELKRVEFTDDERCFYSRLESDSRAQFKEYAAAGTLKKNYVNILLMLLRLRQACDHPLLVRGYESVALGRSSTEMAKTLPPEARICLLNCLEASLAICGLCNVAVIIMSLKAASLGLNMVSACHVLLLDLWWNPTTEDQAIDRAHRIGQTRPVTVFRLTVKDTIEDRILALQEKKREMVASAFGEDVDGGRQTRLTEEDLKYLFMG